MKVTARSYIEQWQSLSISQNETYLLTSFGSPGNNSGSAGLIYNLYADKLLQTNLLNDSVSIFRSSLPPLANLSSQVFDVQTSYYKNAACTWQKQCQYLTTI